MDVVFEIEQATAHTCGEPQGLDLALLLLAREQGGDPPVSVPPVTVPVAPDEHPPSASGLWAVLRKRFGRAPEGETLKETQLFLFLAVIIGLFSGLSVVLFRIAIDWTKLLAFGSGLTPPWTRALMVPTIGGLVVAYLVIRFFPRARGSGVNQTKAAVYIFDGYIPFNTVIGKFITCAFAHRDRAVARSRGPFLADGRRDCLRAGAAAAALARERAPDRAGGSGGGPGGGIQCTNFRGDFRHRRSHWELERRRVGRHCAAAVSSVIVSRWFLGDQALFRHSRLSSGSSRGAAGICGIGSDWRSSSLAFVKLIAYARPRLKALPRWTQYLQPAVAGLLIGVIGIWFPQVMGAGYGYIDQAMHDQFTWQILALLAAFKILSTSLSFVSGTPGGMFAPTLFIGAMLGGAVGGIEHHFFPWLSGGWALTRWWAWEPSSRVSCASP